MAASRVYEASGGEKGDESVRSKNIKPNKWIIQPRTITLLLERRNKADKARGRIKGTDKKKEEKGGMRKVAGLLTGKGDVDIFL